MKCVNARPDPVHAFDPVHALVNLLLFLSCVTFFAFSAEATDIDVKTYEGSRISRFQESGEFVWCGTKHLAISRHSRGTDAGIRLLDIESGLVRQLTTVPTHRVVACTPDGKHIFFGDNGISGAMNELDIDKGRQQVIYSKNVYQHSVIEDAPISPSGEFLIGPATLSEQVILSDRTVKAMRIPDGFLENNVTGIAWAREGAAFLVFGYDSVNIKNNSQKLLIMKSETPRSRVINLPNVPRVKNALFVRAGWSDVAKRLYLLAKIADAKLSELNPLYEFDPAKPTHSLRLIATDVDEFKIMPNGSLVYIQNLGTDYSKLDPFNATHRLLLLRTAQGKHTELLKAPYKSSGISGIQVSPNGENIAVRITKKDFIEIQVFHTVGN